MQIFDPGMPVFEICPEFMDFEHLAPGQVFEIHPFWTDFEHGHSGIEILHLGKLLGFSKMQPFS